MWILQWLPDWIFHVILFLGVVGLSVTYLLKFIPIPAIYIYKTPIQLVSVFFIAFGTFMSGAIYDNDAWQKRVDELEKKVVKAEQESKELNHKLDEKVKSQKEKIVERKVFVNQYIDREVTKYDNSCLIPKEFVNSHNQSSKEIRK